MRIVSGLFLIIVLGGCSHQVDDVPNEPQDVQKKFSPGVQDQKLSFDELKPVKQFFDNHLIRTTQWLGLSNTLFQSAESSVDHEEKVFLANLGLKLSEDYYSYQKQILNMSALSRPMGNPYSEMALPIAHPQMVDFYDEAHKHTHQIVRQTAREMKHCDPVNGNVLGQLKDSIQHFHDALGGNTNDFTRFSIPLIQENLRDQLLKGVNYVSLAHDDKNHTSQQQRFQALHLGLVALKDVGTMADESIGEDIQVVKNIANRMESLETGHDVLSFVIDIWAGSFFEADLSEPLKDSLTHFSESELLALSTKNGQQLLPETEFQILESKPDNTPLEILALYSENGTFFQKDDEEFEDLQKRFNVKLGGHFKDSGFDTFQKVVVSWLQLPLRMKFPVEMVQHLKGYEQAELEDLKDATASWFDSIQSPVLSLTRYLMVDAIDTYKDQGVPLIKSDLYKTVTEVGLEKINEVAHPLCSDISKVIEKGVIASIDEARLNQNKIVEESLMSFGEYYLSKWIFDVKEIAPTKLLEERSPTPPHVISQYPIALIEGDFISESESEGKRLVTSPTTLGVSLINIIERLKRGAGKDSRKLLFQGISKLTLLMGYEPFNGGFAGYPVSIKSGEANSFDVASYKPSEGVYSVPDRIIIGKSFSRLDPETYDQPTVSVMGQMKLVEAASYFLRLFKPWERGVFDVTLGHLRAPENREVSAFPKDDLWAMSLAVASIPLKNIPSEMLVLLNEDGTFTEGVSLDDDMEVSALGAVLRDFSSAGHSKIVRTVDLANAIYSLALFYSESKNLDRAKNESVRESLELLRKHRRTIGALVSGMSVFAFKYLMAPDGGFYSGYDLSKKRVMGRKRRLVDQLEMQKALLKTGELLEAPLISTRAIENLFFLNNVMWDRSLGFYQQAEEDSSSQAHLTHIVSAYHNLQLARPVLEDLLTRGAIGNEPLDQLNRLDKLWFERFLVPMEGHSSAQIVNSSFIL